jgi:hypothetical protein
MNEQLTEAGCKVNFNFKGMTGCCIFDYVYKKSKLCRIQIGGTSGCVVVVFLADTKYGIENAIRALPDDLQHEFIHNKTRGCGLCKGFSCAENTPFEHHSKKYSLCGYIRRNPTTEQFDMIEQLINARKENANA